MLSPYWISPDIFLQGISAHQMPLVFVPHIVLDKRNNIHANITRSWPILVFYTLLNILRIRLLPQSGWSLCNESWDWHWKSFFFNFEPQIQDFCQIHHF
jgi:hypothetical protein